MVNFKPVQIKQRGKSYQLYYYNPRGERRRVSVGDDYQQAQRLAVKYNDLLVEGKDPEQEIKKAQQKEQLKAITIRDFYPIFMERHGSLRTKSMQQSYQNSFKNICRCPQIIDSELSLITKALVLDYMYLRIKEDNVKPASVNREAAFLKCMLSKSYEWEYLDFNPLLGMKLLPESEKREVNLTIEQAQKLLEALPYPVDEIIELAIYTGFRKENILSMRIESIRFHDISPTGEIILNIKGGRTELFPLGPTAVELLKRVIGNRKEGYVFLNPKTGKRYISIHKTFDRTVAKLGFTVNNTKLRIHDLRHVFATWLHREGVSLDALRPLMGHKNRKTTDRYTTIDRLMVGEMLTRMPRIRTLDNKKTLTKTPSESKLTPIYTKHAKSS